MAAKYDEEFKITDKETLASKNICKHCKKLLNVPPIFNVLENDSYDEICGRCNYSIIQPDGNKWRQYTYENFAQYMTYPCCNKEAGCDIILEWHQVHDHEITCKFQETDCPLSYTNTFPGKKCNWRGNTELLNEHVESFHSECIIKSPHFDMLDAKENRIFFTHVGSKLVYVVIIYDEEERCYCLLMVNGSDIESQCYHYQLEIFNEQKDNSILFRKGRLEPLGYILNNMNDPDKMLQIDINVMKEMLQNTDVMYAKFGIVRKSKREILHITERLNGSSSKFYGKYNDILSDENILQELECPICNEYMIPPIYICQTGHSICNQCKLKVGSCPNCRSQFTGARNFTLEKLTAQVHYPCKNRELGCLFITTPDKIQEHEIKCELSDTPCIVNRCTHNCVRANMFTHLTEKHINAILKVNVLNIRDVTDRKETNFVMYVFGELFRFTIKGGANGSLKFNLQHLGTIENKIKFKYQLQLIDESPLKLRFSVTSPCQIFLDKNLVNALTVPWDMLKPFLFDAKLFYYKVNILEIK